jgi:hypothetical protein
VPNVTDLLRGTTATPRRGQWVFAVAAVLTAVGAAALLLWGLSYPGFPVSVTGLVLLCACLSVASAVAWAVRGHRPGRAVLRAAGAVVAVAALLTSGAVVAESSDGWPLRDRWAASRAAFEAEVVTAGPPDSSERSEDAGPVGRYPGSCPPRIGKYRVSECEFVDGGHLFRQAPDALTDDSGILYQSGLGSWADDAVVALGGPWWSWTCSC